MFWGGFECFDGPHDGNTNRSNSQTSLLRVKGSPTEGIRPQLCPLIGCTQMLFRANSSTFSGL